MAWPFAEEPFLRLPLDHKVTFSFVFSVKFWARAQLKPRSIFLRHLFTSAATLNEQKFQVFEVDTHMCASFFVKPSYLVNMFLLYFLNGPYIFSLLCLYVIHMFMSLPSLSVHVFLYVFFSLCLSMSG